MAILHQHVAEIRQHALLAVGFLIELRIWIGRGRVRRIRATFAAEIDVGIPRVVGRLAPIGVPPRAVSLEAGATARIKTLRISGDGPTLIAALEKLAPTR